MNNYELLNTLSQIHTSSSNKQKAIIYGVLTGISIIGICYCYNRYIEAEREIVLQKNRMYKSNYEKSRMIHSLQTQLSLLSLVKIGEDDKSENDIVG